MADKSFDLVGRKLMVAIPCYDGRLNIKTAFALAALVPKLDKMGVQIQLSHLSGCSIITKARNALVTKFMDSDCTDLLFVDSDVIITPEDVIRLLALSGGKDITAGSYPRRADDRKFFLDFYLNDDGELEFDENGLMRVNNVATGFMMIQRHVLETLITNHPEWKYYNNVDDTHESAVFDFAIVDGNYIGEDYLFCQRARAEGFTVFLDTDISLPHVGTTEFYRNFAEDAMKPLLAEHGKKRLKVANG
jgi:hypothetical protein